MRQPNQRRNGQRRKSGPDNIQKFTVPQAGPLLEVAGAILKDHTPTKVKSMLRHNQLAVNGTPSTQCSLFSMPQCLRTSFRNAFAHALLTAFPSRETHHAGGLYGGRPGRRRHAGTPDRLF